MADTFRWSGFAHAMRDGALIHIQNTETADARRTLTLTQWDVRPWVGATNQTSTVGAWRLRGITAHAGGEALPTVAADPSVAALPSQVSVLIQSGVTFDSTASLRDRAALAVSTANISWPAFGRLLPGSPATATLFDSLDTGGALQRITLPAGRGLAIVAADDANAIGPETWYVTLTLRDDTNGRTYFVQGEALGAGSGTAHAVVSVMNAAGSGITLSVADIEIVYAGEPNTTIAPPAVRLMRTNGGNNAGDVLSLVAADPSVVQPAALSVRRSRVNAHDEPNPAAAGLNKDDLGYPSTNVAAWQRVGHLGRRLMGQGTTDGLSQATPNFWREAGEPQYGRRYTGDVTGVVLRPQTGVALVADQPSMYSTYWVEVEVSHTPPPVAASNTYSRARVVNA